ncbi:hypothetical protein J132_10227 [Termitomyces sp. J132]|nr:hypothetical protein J132_10227 [Termitomyces sp. J132]
MPVHWVRQLYNMVAIPAFMYATDIWFTGVSEPINGRRRTEQIKEIKPVRRNLSYRPSFLTHILMSKEEALEAIKEAFNKSNTAIFCDGSGFEGGVRASTVLYINGDEVSHLKYHLGSGAEHMVYEVEIIGLSLGLHILQGLNRKLLGLTMCGSDSQATLRALNNQRPHPAHYLLDRNQFIAQTCSSHKGFSPNERADTLAKEAATGLLSPWNLLPASLHLKPLPISIPALRQADQVTTQVL